MSSRAGAALAALLVLPGSAQAAVATADVERRAGAGFGPVTFRAAPGEANRLTVEQANGRLRFRDSANAVRARGDCRQVDRHTASCPVTEDVAVALLGDRDDSAQAAGLVEVRGGAGDDRLRGSPGIDRLAGGGGADLLEGRGDGDWLNGGHGRDRVFGGPGDDDLVDGETDARSAPDLYRGGSSRDGTGPDRGDSLDYSLRTRPLRVDLARGRASTGDVIRGLESVSGGSGDDRLSGDGDDNWLDGNGGDDRLDGRGGRDIPRGGPGDDRVRGGSGDDVVWGDAGADLLLGGPGDDLLLALDGGGDTASCGRGADDVRSGPADTLVRCELSNAGELRVGVRPDVAGGTATYRVACGRVGGCSGAIELSSPAGTDFGSGRFTGLPSDPQTFSDVDVELTSAGAAAFARGDAIVVRYGSRGGFRARSG